MSQKTVRKTGSGDSPKVYDKAYFDRWYRSPSERVTDSGALERKVRLVLGTAEWLLGRQVRSVLDVGCGEGSWRGVLRRIRPRLEYLGVDSSEYAIRRFGRRRDLRLGSFAGIGDAVPLRRYDLVVCCDVIQYLEDVELRKGLAEIVRRLGGLAFLEAYAAEDRVTGDRHAWMNRSCAELRRIFRGAGLTGVGMNCWVGEKLLPHTLALDRSVPV